MNNGQRESSVSDNVQQDSNLKKGILASTEYCDRIHADSDKRVHLPASHRSGASLWRHIFPSDESFGYFKRWTFLTYFGGYFDIAEIGGYHSAWTFFPTRKTHARHYAPRVLICMCVCKNTYAHTHIYMGTCDGVFGAKKGVSTLFIIQGCCRTPYSHFP